MPIPVFTYRSRVSRGAMLSCALAAVTISGAGAATFHRLAVTQTSGSGGDQAILQTSASGSALQGEVGASANGSIKLPFGVLGEFDPSSSAFGVGTLGISTTGYAVAGESLSDTQPTFLAFPGGNGMGLEAVTKSTSVSPAIFAQSSGTGDGVDGAATNGGSMAGVVGEDLSNSDEVTDGVLGTTSNGGYGVEGTSANGALGGMHGFATTGVGVRGESNSGIGVYGVNNQSPAAASPAPVGMDVGLYAVSGVGEGIYAQSTDDSAIYAESANGVGVQGHAAGKRVGVVGYNDAPALQNGDTNLITNYVGVTAVSTVGTGLFATTTNADGAWIQNNDPNYSTLVLYNGDAGDLIEAGNAQCAGYCFEVDTYGDLYVDGFISDQNGTFARTRNPNSDAMSYGAQVAEPTMEDVGRAQLVNGSASVPLRSDFRQTIDSAQYMVFLTPHGDSNGLYVASESAGGFVVRESHAGRSTLGFDYRIVAQQFGAKLGRLPRYASLHKRGSKMHRAGMAASTFERSAPANTRQPSGKLRSRHLRRFVPPPITTMPSAAGLR